MQGIASANRHTYLFLLKLIANRVATAMANLVMTTSCIQEVVMLKRNR